ncbi:MAG: hypothetical protein ABI206_13265, partial [Antricoccus sp.]
ATEGQRQPGHGRIDQIPEASDWSGTFGTAVVGKKVPRSLTDYPMTSVSRAFSKWGTHSFRQHFYVRSVPHFSKTASHGQMTPK